MMPADTDVSNAHFCYLGSAYFDAIPGIKIYYVDCFGSGLCYWLDDHVVPCVRMDNIVEQIYQVAILADEGVLVWLLANLTL